MSRYSIQKMVGLIILYTLIIVGIFALQFRNQSIFSKNFYQIRLTLSQNKSSEEGSKPFNDTFFIAFRGITIFSDGEEKPILQKADGSTENLIFENWNEIDSETFVLNFSDGISVTCKAEGEEKDGLSLRAKVPAGCKIILPYKLSKSYTITDSTAQKITLKSSSTQTIITAPRISEKTIELSSQQNVLTYNNFKPVTQFQFSSIAENELASNTQYKENIQRIRNYCLTQFEQNIDSINENAVNAYMAEMTARNRYMETATKIPATFKNSSKRTYVTAPYLNNLVSMNSSLVMQTENMNYKMNFSLEKQNLSIFETEHLASFLLTRPFGKSLAILALPSKMQNFAPTVQQAAGILETYTDLKSVDTSMSNLLHPVLEKSVETIEKNCSIENDILYISSNNERLDDITAIRIGKILCDYGKSENENDVMKAGIMMMNCRIPQNSELDIQKAGNIYSILQDKSSFLPHFQTIYGTSEGAMWAWTVAQSIGYKEADDVITLSIKFPQDASHYVIINGVKPFKSIEIYGMKFRTDPRFEAYNSSGYVYDEKTQTLFLKCRHKKEVENIRLFYREEEPLPTVQENENSQNTESSSVKTDESTTMQASENVSDVNSPSSVE